MALNPKVLNVRRAEYLPAVWGGKNTSGCIPVGDRVLILPDIALAKSGGIDLPDAVVERAQLSASSGLIIAMGDDAFAWNSDRTRPFAGYKPQAGDYVHFDRYSGKVILGEDGVEYRIVDDKSIGGVKKTA